MQESIDWRALLKSIIQDRDLLEKLAQEIHVNPLTLIRWTAAKKSITPHRAHLEQLVTTMSFPEQHRGHMIALLQQEFPDFRPVSPLSVEAPAPGAIPQEFYHRVLRSYSLTEENLSFATIVQLVTQQLAVHLGTKNNTLRSGIFLLTPPTHPSTPVRSLYLPIQPGGMRLTALPKTFPIFAGIESLLSFALRTPTSPMVFSVEEMPMPSFPELTDIQSTLVIPLQRKGKVGGCFLISSARPHFFADHASEEVACSYGFLLSLALEDRDFYDPTRIAFCVFPSLQEQLEREKTFPFSERIKRAQSRVLHHLFTDEEQTTPVEGILSLKQLERAALQELEEELIVRAPMTQQKAPDLFTLR